MLNEAKVRAAKPRKTPYKLTDGHRLYLLVKPNGSKLWKWNYRYGDKQKTMAFGIYPMVGLADARDKCDAARSLVDEGRDPAVVKRLTVEANLEAGRLTFEFVAREWHENARPQWAKVHAADTIRSLERDVFPSIGALPIAQLFEPLKLGSIEARNRLAVAPMTRVSATEAGYPTDRMADYYAAFADGGFGIVITEGIYPDQAWSQGYFHQPGLSDDAQRDAWKPLVERVHAGGARFIAQLMHAGALSQGNRFVADTRGPSALRPKGQQMSGYRGSGAFPVPAKLTQAEIDAAVAGFASAAVRAREAGFDGVEIHGANGYLLDQFLTEGVNERTDRYGGDVTNRLRLTLEVVREVRAAVGPDFVVGVRSSQAKVNDFTHKWRGVDEAAETYALLGQAPVDYLHTTEYEAWKPAFGDGPSLAALARRHGGLPVLVNGSLHDPGRALDMLNDHGASMVTLGRGALVHADWPMRVAQALDLAAFDPRMLTPLADLASADRFVEESRVPA